MRTPLLPLVLALAARAPAQQAGATRPIELEVTWRVDAGEKGTGSFEGGPSVTEFTFSAKP